MNSNDPVKQKAWLQKNRRKLIYHQRKEYLEAMATLQDKDQTLRTAVTDTTAELREHAKKKLDAVESRRDRELSRERVAEPPASGAESGLEPPDHEPKPPTPEEPEPGQTLE